MSQTAELPRVGYIRMDHGTVEDYALAAELAEPFYADIAADVLRPYVSRHTHWMIKHHGVFQGYYFWDKIGKDKNERERFRGHPAFDMTERFTGEYDQMAFDPDYDTPDMDHFKPMVERIFARTPWGEHTKQDWPVE